MTVKSLRLTSTLFVSALSINSAMALPIDWTGVFGVDTHNISNTCRTGDTVGPELKPGPGNPAPNDVRNGSQALRNGDCGASFQTYTMRLNPNIIVNDGVTLKGELSSGYLRGGFAGDNSANNLDGSGNNAYFFTTPAQRSALNVNQMYMELYADTALVKIGRFARGFGMGMIFDDGRDPWDRFLTMYDGIDAEMKIGNFSVAPYYAKISSYNDTKNSAQPVGDMDVRELGLVAKYDNKNKDLVASVLYAKRSSEAQNSLYNANNTTDADSFKRGKTEVTIIDAFVSKKWNKFKVIAEASLQTGDYGDVYEADDASKISANSGVVDLKYDLNPKWDMGFLAGQASGDKGSSDKFEASYLNPNFQIADLMFRYNYAAFNEGGRSIFDSSITNARFFKLYGNYKTDKWTWKGALIMANALETAKAGSRAYHHEENYAFQSNYKQDSNYGWEIDLGFDYRWNPNVTIGGYYGYWMVGDYYAYTNNAATNGKELSLSNVHGGGLRATLEF